MPTLLQKGNAMLSNTTMDRLINQVNVRFNEELPKKMRPEAIVDGLEALISYYRSVDYQYGKIIVELNRAKASFLNNQLSVAVFRDFWLPHLISTAIKDSFDHFWIYKGCLANVIIPDENIAVTVSSNMYQIKLRVRVIGQNNSTRQYKELYFDIQSGDYVKWLELHLDQSNPLAMKESVTRIAHSLLVN